MKNMYATNQCTERADACTSASSFRALLVIIANVIIMAFVFLCLLGRVESIIILAVLITLVLLFRMKMNKT